jgi:hypothetical protein
VPAGFTQQPVAATVSYGMLRHFTIVLALLVLAAACAPAVESPRLEVQQLTEPPSFYPHETGARWVYVRDGAAIDGIRYVETVEGPAVIDGDVWIASRLVGGGQDVTHYRQYRADGVYLRRQTRPGATIDFVPPIREYPAQGELRVGTTWRAETVADQHYPSAAPGLRRLSVPVEYVYTVIDERPVNVAGSEYRVFVIDRTVRQYDDDGAVADQLSRTTWFAPFVGTVRHENGWFLVETNVGTVQP